MNRHTTFGGLVLAAMLGVWTGRVSAQAMLADDIIILSKGQQEQEKSRSRSQLGGAPGAGGSPFRSIPGVGANRPGERGGPGALASPVTGKSVDVLSAASGYESGSSGQPGRAGIAPTTRLPSQAVQLFGPLELPEADDEGPRDGLTLDMAIERLLGTNPGLHSKAQEMPNAQADILSAGLKANPLIFASADSVPYGSYSQRRPGENTYAVTLIQPVDVNRKRGVRVIVAQQAKKVIEAQYQDAVRLEIDNLYTAYVDALDARDAVRYAKASLKGLDDLLMTSQEQFKKGFQPETEVDSATIQRDSAEIGLEQAEVAYRQVKRTLATLLGIPPAETDLIELRASVRDSVPTPPPIEDLVRLALCTRPDVVAYRLGVGRAQAAVKLERAERFPDVFMLYTPYGFRNNTPVGEKSATSWGIGALVSIPLFNRNQGNIARAQGTVIQTKIELAGLERQVVTEVECSALEYGSTQAAVQKLETSILPRARRLRDRRYRLYTEGQENVVTYLNAQRDYNEAVRQYRNTLIRHRRSMLRLNTAVGQRILP